MYQSKSQITNHCDTIKIYNVYNTIITFKKIKNSYNKYEVWINFKKIQIITIIL